MPHVSMRPEQRCMLLVAVQLQALETQLTYQGGYATLVFYTANDKVAATNLRLVCDHDINPPADENGNPGVVSDTPGTELPLPGGATAAGSWRTAAMCEPGQYVCGIGVQSLPYNASVTHGDTKAWYRFYSSYIGGPPTTLYSAPPDNVMVNSLVIKVGLSNLLRAIIW